MLPPPHPPEISGNTPRTCTITAYHPLWTLLIFHPSPATHHTKLFSAYATVRVDAVDWHDAVRGYHLIIGHWLFECQTTEIAGFDSIVNLLGYKFVLFEKEKVKRVPSIFTFRLQEKQGTLKYFAEFPSFSVGNSDSVLTIRINRDFVPKFILPSVRIIFVVFAFVLVRCV